MKKIILYISAFVVAGSMMASCDINKPDIFDDANAFVAFDNATMTVDEDYSAEGAVLKVPVTLASVAGIEENVSFRVVEGTAKEGVNYELLTTSGVLSFNAENRTRYIEFEILQDGKFTGDLKFTVEFVNTNSVKQGAENTCVVTIGDIDHPFSALFGTYTFTGTSYYDNEISWTATMYKDESDVNRIWILNLPGLSNGFETVVDYYGTVDDDMTTITIPFNQTTPSYQYQGYDVFLYGIDAETKVYDSGSLVGTIQKDGSGNVTGIDFGSEYGVYCEIDQVAALQAILPGISATKN